LGNTGNRLAHAAAANKTPTLTARCAFSVSAMPDFSADTLPLPPLCPGDDECCRSGCAPCVFDRYAEELAHYRALMRAWEERQAGNCEQAASSC